MQDETVERFELKLAFLERANQELSDVIYRQQQEIDQLRAQLLGLTSRIDSLRDTSTAYTDEEERPPHY
jgi:uncharacterized coiled-coil protein SlyX